MDFFYYNKNNELLKLNIQVGSNWNDLNIQNESLNSIFFKIDNGDNKITDQNELTILQKLLNKADGILNKDNQNQILENDELEEVINQIDNEKIILPTNNNKEESYIEAVTHHPQYTKEESKDLKNPQTYDKAIEQQINRIKANLKKYYHYDERFSEDRYKIDVRYNGKYFESFVYDKVTRQLSQGINIIRSDGIELSFKDYYKDAISDDDKADYSKNHQSADFGELIITGSDGKSHSIEYQLEDLFGRDVLDCRRVIRSVGEYFASLPKETIDELIDKNVTSIYLTSDYEDLFLEDKDYYRKKMYANGTFVWVLSELFYRSIRRT